MACRTARPKRELVRIVRSPDGVVGVDDTGRRAGRGAYVCRSAACLTIANTRSALSRALKTQVPTALLSSVALGADIEHDTTQGGARGQE